jgi:NADPH:quinone reductase-like Zn-dependent oxidoreductase
MKSKEIRSKITDQAKLELSIEEVEINKPAGSEVLVKVQASPINPSDIGVMLASADPRTLKKIKGNFPKVSMDIDKSHLPFFAKRLNKSLNIGNEGAGKVVDAGKDSKHLIGKIVSVSGGSTFSQYKCTDSINCIEMKKGITAKKAASGYINPLTALGMVETMRVEGHSAIIHTAAASSLGQMLVKICNEDRIYLINIVRKDDQVQLLESLGAKYVLNSSSPDFMRNLIKAIIETGATIAFDATGGGQLTDQILTAMEFATSALEEDSPISIQGYSPYGSSAYKQVYIYGGLDPSPMMLNKAYGMNWSAGGWLLFPFVMALSEERLSALQERIKLNVDTTFKSTFKKTIGLEDALKPKYMKEYLKTGTGNKYLINPQIKTIK